jgi:hypothetical protein
MTPCLCTCTEVTTSTPPDPVAVWFDETGQLMSDLGPVDRNCVVRVIGAHCPDRHQCVLLYRAPGPRLLYGSELMSELDDERGLYLETHAKHLEDDLISITVDHVGADGGPGSWRYRLLPMRWKTEDGLSETSTRLAVWPD